MRLEKIFTPLTPGSVQRAEHDRTGALYAPKVTAPVDPEQRQKREQPGNQKRHLPNGVETEEVLQVAPDNEQEPRGSTLDITA